MTKLPAFRPPGVIRTNWCYDLGKYVSDYCHDIINVDHSTAVEVPGLRWERGSAAEEDVDALNLEIEALSELAEQVEDLSDAISDMTSEIELLDESMTSVEIPAAALTDRSQIVLSMVLLTRARLWIEEDNLGLAAEDISAAKDVLEAIDAQSEDMAETLEDILDRLDNALDDVRRYPQVAASELEIAWKLLTELASTPAVTAELEPTPTPTEEAQSD